MADIISPLADVSRFQPTVKPFLKPLIEVQERQLPLLTGGNGPPIGVVEDSIPLNLSKEVDKIRSDALANIRYFKSTH